MAFILVQNTTPSSFVVSPVSRAFGSNNAAGNLLFAILNMPNTAAGLTISDTLTNTWAQLAVVSTNGVGNELVVYYCLNSKAGANTVQLSWTGGGTSAMMLAEFSPGAGNVAVLDTSNTNQGNASPENGGSITPAQASELIIMAIANSGGGQTYVPGAGFTMLNPSVSQFQNMEYNLSGSSGAQTPTMTAAGANYGATSAAFKTASTVSSDVIVFGIAKPCIIYGRAPNGVLSAVTTDGNGNIDLSGQAPSTVDTIGNSICTPVMIYGRAPDGTMQAVTTDGDGQLS